jgi:hypothetical protein
MPNTEAARKTDFIMGRSMLVNEQWAINNEQLMMNKQQSGNTRR